MPETAESVAAKLREEIRSGDLPVGAKVPLVAELMDRFGVGRGAAQQALATLRAEGLVTSQRGAPGVVLGVFARIERVMPDRILESLREPSSPEIQRYDAGPRQIGGSVEVDEVPAPDFVAEALGIKVGVPVVRRARVHVMDRLRVQLSASHFPTDLARGTAIVYQNPGPNGVYGRLADQGWPVENWEERIVARPPLPEEAAVLDLPRSRGQVLQITRFAYSRERCVEVNRMIADAEKYELVNKFRA